MKKLVQLELQRINLRPYFIASSVIAVILTLFLYFIATVAQITKEVQFMHYDNIFLFINLIGILLFGILAATMYAKLVIEEYSGKRLSLLFSYPKGRASIFLAKVWIVFIFVVFSMLFCILIPIAIFIFTESFVPIVSDLVTKNMITDICTTLFVSLCSVNAIGLLAMFLGFIKKSVPVTLISAFIFAAIYGNITSYSIDKPIILLVLLATSFFIIVIVFIALSHKINCMEVE